MASLFYVAAGRNSRHGHPHPDVEQEVRQAGGTLFVVSEEPWTEVLETVTIGTDG
jgi:hypothetical protein